MSNSPEDYRKCAAEGLTRTQTALRLGVCKSTVKAASLRHNIAFAPTPYVNYSCQPVLSLGVNYPSQTAFARAKGVKPATVWMALNRGTIDNVGQRKPVTMPQMPNSQR